MNEKIEREKNMLQQLKATEKETGHGAFKTGIFGIELQVAALEKTFTKMFYLIIYM